jgi:hypothetical protein
MRRVFIAITLVFLFTVSACVQDHEPSFFPEEIGNILTGFETAAWQVDAIIENGNRINLSECEKATLLVFYRTSEAFELIDVEPFCNSTGGVIDFGTWEVKVNEQTNDRRLTLSYDESINLTYQIDLITPFRLRLVRNIRNGESTSQEILEYVRVEFEEEEEESN